LFVDQNADISQEAIHAFRIGDELGEGSRGEVPGLDKFKVVSIVLESQQ